MSATISPNYNMQTPSFKAHYVVQVSKKGFKSPKNYDKCLESFEKVINKQTGERLNGMFSSVLPYFTTKPYKTSIAVENYSYILTKDVLQESGYLFQWFKEKTGLTIGDTASKQHHTFHVYTKDEIEKSMDALKKGIKNLSLYIKEAAEKYPDDKKMQLAYARCKMAIDIDTYTAETMKDVPTGHFRIKSLDALKGVVSKMDY